MYSLTGDEYIENVVTAYSRSMLNVAYSLLKSVPDAEDAVQEAFLRLIEKKPEFNDSSHEKAWLLRVTINISKNMLKACGRKSLPLQEDIPYEDKDSSVLLCVMALEEKYRTIIHLYYYEDYSIKEISSILNLPQATVGTRLSRARRLLKTMLKGDFDL
ncbi:MAG: sigma-70 family RNA polymerase sigma factor [Clostridia bacterium]|nr:sigma-70 family RNA polymerase sigma factor [Clostridia bacterium]